MSYLTWSERLERFAKRARRAIVRKNVRAYRRRQAAEGVRRIDVALSREDFARLTSLMHHNETFSAAISRAIVALSGNTRQLDEGIEKQGLGIVLKGFSEALETTDSAPALHHTSITLNA